MVAAIIAGWSHGAPVYVVYAFTVGMVATANPCGFAMLPLYVAQSARPAQAQGLSRVANAIWTGVAASAGFVVVFGLAGLAVSAGLSAVMAYAPWVMVGFGGLLGAFGLAVALGWHPDLRLPGQGYLDAVFRRSGWPRSAAFGAAYALASLSCSLPIFLAGVAGAFTQAGFAAGVGAFVAYGLGMGVVFSALAVAVGLAGPGFLRRGRRLGARLERPFGVLLALVGSYLVYYWALDLSGRPGQGSLVGLVERAQSAVAGAVSSGGLLLAVGLAGFVAAVAALAALGEASRHRRGLRQALAAPTGSVPSAVEAPAVLPASPSPSGGSGEPAGRPGNGNGVGHKRSRRGGRPPVLIAVIAALVLGAYLGAVLALRPGAGRPVTVEVSSGPGALAVSPAVEQLTSLDPLSRSSWYRAPAFTLVDQHGRAVSLSSFRGKAVVLAFMDNHCTDVCPLFAQDVRAAAEDLGPLTRRVAFVAVNANPFYPQVSWDVAFDRREGLGSVPDWAYLTGQPAELRRVWRAYGIYVGLDYKNRTVEHGTYFYLIGPGGRVRAVGEYGWSSVDTASWGNALATLTAEMVGAHRHFPAHVVYARRPQGRSGWQAPSFAAASLSRPGSQVGLAQFAGRPLVVNFFASWCTDCRAEAPALERLARRYRGKVGFVGIDTDDADASAGRQFLRTFGVTYPVASDPQGIVASRYGVEDLPTTFVVSSAGTVLHDDLGPVSVASLGAQLAALVDRPAAAPPASGSR